MRRIKVTLASALLTSLLGVVFMPFGAKAAQYIFPVLGSSSFSNDFNAYRGNTYNGRHNAIDIIANKHQKIVAAASGTIVYVTYPEPSWGNAVIIKSTGGYCYWYLHMNNDTPGTDNGRGGAMKAFAPDMKIGNPVKAGQLLGWVGDSGSSENTVSHLHFEVLKARSNGTCDLSGRGTTHINPYNSLRSARRISSPVTYSALPGEMLPFGSKFTGGANIAVDDINDDGQIEQIVGVGAEATPKVKIFSSSGQLLYNFYPFNTSIEKGTDVAVGDFDGDGEKELAVVAVTNSGARIKTYRLLDGGAVEQLTEFGTFGASHAMPSISAGDLNGDGTDEIIIGAGAGLQPRVNVFDKEGAYLRSFYPYGLEFKGGVAVASGDISTQAGVVRDELIVAPGTTGSSRIITYSLDVNFQDEPTKLGEFYAYGSVARGGSRVDVGNVNTNTPLEEIVTMPHQNFGPVLRTFNGQGQQQSSRVVWEEWWRGSYDVAAGEDYVKAATGINRRVSIR